MLATTPSIPAPTMPAHSMEYDYGPLGDTPAAQRQLRRHKALPHPHDSQDQAASSSHVKPMKTSLTIDTSSTSPSAVEADIPSPQTLKHQARRIGSGPELPPTPPNHSRTSSSTQSALPSSPTAADSGLRTPQNVSSRGPATPPDQRSPPTPDVTPPQPASRPKALRPSLVDRTFSRTTTDNSRTESFTTAREEPVSSEEDDGRSTARPSMHSRQASLSTVRQAPNPRDSRVPDPQALDMALSQLHRNEAQGYTRKSRADGDRCDESRERPLRNTRTRVHHAPPTMSSQQQRPRPRGPREPSEPVVAQDIKHPVKPTNATEEVRQMPLQIKPVSQPATQPSSDRPSVSSAPSNSSTSLTTSQKRSSGMSTSTTVSARVQPIAASQPPEPQRTLRHVRKQRTLRQVVATPPPQPLAKPAPVEDLPAPRQPTSGPDTDRRESQASTMTVGSMASGKARREVRKSGGVPVVVIPDRRSSHHSKPSREPSLRSTSSRRSRRTQSLSSAPVEVPASTDVGPVFERTLQRSQAYSSSVHSSDSRTIDFPPAIPRRSSSLSAPTSRNVSRSNSISAETFRPRELQRYGTQERQERRPSIQSASSVSSPVAVEFPKFRRDEDQDRNEGDHQEDYLSIRRCEHLNTPFSVASAETSGTAAEVSEAFAIQMYPHQNSSVLMVNHSARPSEASNIAYNDFAKPTVTVNGEEPMTPPQPQFSLDDVESPLRNPRAPPEPPNVPPAINFIPATPSGVTPAPDKAAQLGNYYEAMAEPPPEPKRRRSIVERAFSRRRNSTTAYPPNAFKTPGFLSRGWSLSRRRRSVHEERPRRIFDDTPPEEDKLHPFWRPQWPMDSDYDSNEDDDYSDEEEDERDTHLKYPLVDNRPKPRRSLSERVRRTFAIMPLRDSERYTVDDTQGPERRTIQRTPSGNLRVMRRRTSVESLKEQENGDDRPYTAPDGGAHRSMWRSNSVQNNTRPQHQRRFSLSSHIEEIQNLPRRLSEKRREKRTEALRRKISAPMGFKDGVEDMIRSGNSRNYAKTNGQL